MRSLPPAGTFSSESEGNLLSAGNTLRFGGKFQYIFQTKFFPFEFEGISYNSVWHDTWYCWHFDVSFASSLKCHVTTLPCYDASDVNRLRNATSEISSTHFTNIIKAIHSNGDAKDLLLLILRTDYMVSKWPLITIFEFSRLRRTHVHTTLHAIYISIHTYSKPPWPF